MKGILMIIISLFILLMTQRPVKNENRVDNSFNTFSLGSAPVEIFVSIKSSVPENASPFVKTAISGNHSEVGDQENAEWITIN